MGSLSTKLGACPNLIVVVISIGLMTACVSRRSPECKAFLKLAPHERQIEVEKYPLDKQIDLYLCAMKQEPPDLELAYRISDRGEVVIPTLSKRLKTTESEVDQYDLIYVFEILSRKGHLKGQTGVVADIEEVVNSMSVPPIRDDARESLKRIQTNSSIKPFTHVQ